MASPWDDQKAASFRALGERPFSKLLDASLIYYMGDLNRKQVLDVGCGDGRFCRKVKSSGATYVMGVDIAPGMIQAAYSIDKSTNCCDYRVGNALTLGKLGDFDFVTSSGLLPFAESISELKAIANNFYLNLKPGGKSLSITMNVREDGAIDQLAVYYGLGSVKKLPPTSEANRFKYSAIKDGVSFTVTLFYFEPKVYKDVFIGVGFQSFTFMPIVFTNEITRQYEEGHWDIYKSRPAHLCCIASK